MTLVLVSGVGTDIGKTHVTVGLLRAWAKVAPVMGYKPVESGVLAEMGPDEAALAAASTFHVKHLPPTLRLRLGVSPHLAARAEGRSVELDGIVEGIARSRLEGDLVVELPGGIFSPLTDERTNADLAALLQPDVLLLVAPDRLGVLHDVGAVLTAFGRRSGEHASPVRSGGGLGLDVAGTSDDGSSPPPHPSRSADLPALFPVLRAEQGDGARCSLRIDGVVLSAPAVPDASTGTNAAELSRVFGVAVLAYLRRAPVDELVRSGELDPLVAFCRRGANEPQLA